jgi:hypothetical protein
VILIGLIVRASHPRFKYRLEPTPHLFCYQVFKQRSIDHAQIALGT